MKHAFVSPWGQILHHHHTQITKLMNGSFLSYSQLRHGFADSVNLKMKLSKCETITLVTSLVNDYREHTDASFIGYDLSQMEEPRPKVIIIELNGLAHYSYAQIENKLPAKALENFAKSLACADLVIAQSESSMAGFKALVPEANVQLFGFIPEPTALYDYCTDYPEFRLGSNLISVGIGAKGGLGRGGLPDVFAASLMREYLDDGKEVVLVPLIADLKVPAYDVLADGLNMQIVPSQMQSYSDFLKRLSSLDVVINMDSLDGASRLASECARVKTPCIGMRHSMYQKKYFKELSFDAVNLDNIARLAAELVTEGKEHKLVKRAYKRAIAHDRDAHIKEWKTLMGSIGVEI